MILFCSKFIYSAGAVYMYCKIYQDVRLQIFKEASLHWISTILEQGKMKNGLAGLKSFYGAHGWKNELGLLEGIAGIMLVLMAITRKTEPYWDECFLLR